MINFRDENKKNEGIEIKEGEVFRIGRQIMKLKFLSVKQKAPKRRQSQMGQFMSVRELNVMDSLRDLPEQINQELSCRICLEEETPTNRFHNFCVCYKTMPTHLSCL